MNVSFRNDAIPFMLFLPNFKNATSYFTRHDDIWGGYMFQKAAQLKGFALSYGDPIVWHDTIVIPEEDARDEEGMIAFEKLFYKTVDHAFNHLSHTLGSDFTPSEMYDCITQLLEDDPNTPFKELIPALVFAGDTFDEDEYKAV